MMRAPALNRPEIGNNHASAVAIVNNSTTGAAATNNNNNNSSLTNNINNNRFDQTAIIQKPAQKSKQNNCPTTNSKPFDTATIAKKKTNNNNNTSTNFGFNKTATAANNITSGSSAIVGAGGQRMALKLASLSQAPVNQQQQQTAQAQVISGTKQTSTVTTGQAIAATITTTAATTTTTNRTTTTSTRPWNQQQQHHHQQPAALYGVLQQQHSNPLPAQPGSPLCNTLDCEDDDESDCSCSNSLECLNQQHQIITTPAHHPHLSSHQNSYPLQHGAGVGLHQHHIYGAHEQHVAHNQQPHHHHQQPHQQHFHHELQYMNQDAHPHHHHHENFHRPLMANSSVPPLHSGSSSVPSPPPPAPPPPLVRQNTYTATADTITDSTILGPHQHQYSTHPANQHHMGSATLNWHHHQHKPAHHQQQQYQAATLARLQFNSNPHPHHHHHHHHHQYQQQQQQQQQQKHRQTVSFRRSATASDQSGDLLIKPGSEISLYDCNELNTLGGMTGTTLGAHNNNNNNSGSVGKLNSAGEIRPSTANTSTASSKKRQAGADGNYNNDNQHESLSTTMNGQFIRTTNANNDALGGNPNRHSMVNNSSNSNCPASPIMASNHLHSSSSVLPPNQSVGAGPNSAPTGQQQQQAPQQQQLHHQHPSGLGAASIATYPPVSPLPITGPPAGAGGHLLTGAPSGNHTFDTFSMPAITSHRTNSPWMRISSIILTPIGIVIILFIVVSPLLHYLM